jgi:hypothetical protein
MSDKSEFTLLLYHIRAVCGNAFPGELSEKSSVFFIIFLKGTPHAAPIRAPAA